MPIYTNNLYVWSKHKQNQETHKKEDDITGCECAYYLISISKKKPTLCETNDEFYWTHCRHKKASIIWYENGVGLSI